MKSAGDSEVVVGVQRITWPMVTDKNEYVNNPESNPFQDEFYDNYSQPTLATYKKQNGLLSNRFGKLPKFAKKLRPDIVFLIWFLMRGEKKECMHLLMMVIFLLHH